MTLLAKLRATDGDLERLFEVLLPGTSAAIKALRTSACALCSDPLVTAALILGPSGTGKSTVARAVALGRYLRVLTAERAREFLGTVKLDGPGRIADHSLPWYVEFAVPGVAESVASAQLFGYVKGVSGGSNESGDGVFRRAAFGRRTKDDSPDGARATGGVVFLDEIADLPHHLQPKLLSVLTRSPTWRVGGEGNGEHEHVFEGLTLGATWRSLEDPHSFRPDLLTRFSDHILRVPSLNERKEDLEAIVAAVDSEVREQATSFYEAMINKKLVQGLDKRRLGEERQRILDASLTDEDMQALHDVDWTAIGDLRGLTQVVRRRLLGGPPLKDTMRHPTPTRADNPEALLEKMLCKPQPLGAKTVVAAVREIEDDERIALFRYLRENATAAGRLQEHLGLPQKTFSKQLSELRPVRESPGSKSGKRRNSERDPDVSA